MANRTVIAQVAVALFISFLAIQSAYPQAQRAKYPLTKFDNYGCLAKGRVQDCRGKVIEQILADGGDAIPILISQLTDTSITEKQVADYWSDTRSGDVAFVVLNDLFTDTDLHTFRMPGVPDWSAIQKGCNAAAQACWEEYLRKHGRMSVRQVWQHAWNLHKNQIHWDATARCFQCRRGITHSCREQAISLITPVNDRNGDVTPTVSLRTVPGTITTCLILVQSSSREVWQTPSYGAR
jgi:hypothetical protein